MEVHAGSPGGPLVGSGLSGTVTVSAADATDYYLQDVTGGKRLTMGNALATEHIAAVTGARCSAVPQPAGTLYASPNPVLTCSETAGLTGTQTNLTGSPSQSLTAGRNWTEIHTTTPAGPLFSAGWPTVSSTTGDWVVNGSKFFLMQPATPTPIPLAAETVYTLPIRACVAQAPTPAAMAPNPERVGACDPLPVSTLAWYSGGVQPVEIREGSMSGRILGRIDATSGLFDVKPLSAGPSYMLPYEARYVLAGYSAGSWQQLSEVTVFADKVGCKP